MAWINNFSNFQKQETNRNWINNVNDRIKKLVCDLLIDENNKNNKLIELFLIENKDKFKWKTAKESSEINSDILKIDFKNCAIINNYDLSDPLFRIILINIIKNTYSLNNSKHHEITYFEKEKIFYVLEYKHEIKRYHQYSPESMQWLIDEFIQNVNFYEIISGNINNAIDVDNYTIDDLKEFYSWWYKTIILDIIKKEIIKELPNFVFDKLNNEVYLWMVQYLYRTNYDDINNILSKEFNLILDKNIKKILDSSPETKMKIKKFIAEKVSKDIILYSDLNKRSANYIFNEWIKPLIEYIDIENKKNISKIKNNPIYKEKLVKENLIRNTIIDLWVNIGTKIINEYSQAHLWIEMHNSLKTTIIYNNLFQHWFWSISYEISKLIFKYLYESHNSKKWWQIIEWYKYFLKNFSWSINENWTFFPYAKFSFDYFKNISKWETYRESFMMKFDIISSKIKNNKINYNISWINTKNRIEDTLHDIIPIYLVERDGEISIWEWEYLLYNLIKEFACYLLKSAK